MKESAFFTIVHAFPEMINYKISPSFKSSPPEVMREGKADCTHCDGATSRRTLPTSQRQWIHTLVMVVSRQMTVPIQTKSLYIKCIKKISVVRDLF